MGEGAFGACLFQHPPCARPVVLAPSRPAESSLRLPPPRGAGFLTSLLHSGTLPPQDRKVWLKKRSVGRQKGTMSDRRLERDMVNQPWRAAPWTRNKAAPKLPSPATPVAEAPWVMKSSGGSSDDQ